MTATLLFSLLGFNPTPAHDGGHMKPCLLETRIVWVKSTLTCPTGTTPVPNACDEGFCVAECTTTPCEGTETVDAVMCCEQVSGDQDCFQIYVTTMECPPGHDVLYCEHGMTHADGFEECYFD